VRVRRERLDLPIVARQEPPHIGNAVRVVWRGLLAELDRRLADAGFDDLRPAHGAVFQTINAGGSRVTDMAEEAQISKQAMGELVTELERRGYLERRPDPSDGRAKLVHVTQRGWDSIDVARSAFADMEAAWAAELGEDRVRELRWTLGDVEALLSGTLRSARGGRLAGSAPPRG
jgi:DNA-binding MarR family transcriptional regulator